MSRRSRIDERAAITKRSEDYTELIKKFTNPALTEIGNYKIIKEIGHGAFGQVFLAYHKLLRVKVVLKKGLKTLDSDNLMREYYSLREFRNHPHIAKIYEIIITETHAYMVLEYYPNGDLFEYLTARRKLSLDESLYFFTQICGAVHYIHRNNCCHRDLKLENILLDNNLNIKLSDLGFTRELPYSLNQRSKALLNEFCGTTAYMAPEIIKRQPYSGIKIDIWALGVILYTLITGVMPFDDSLPDEELERAILETEPEYNSNLISKTEVIILLQTMLLKNPDDRPNSLETILELPLLSPYGGDFQLATIDKVVRDNLTGKEKTFSSSEKQLIKELKNLGIDKELLVKSIENDHLDSVVGFWELLKEKKKNSMKKKSKSRSRSMLRLNSSKHFTDAKSAAKAPLMKLNSSISIFSSSSLTTPQPQIKSQTKSADETPPSTPLAHNDQLFSSPTNHTADERPQKRIVSTPSSLGRKDSVSTSIDQPLELKVRHTKIPPATVHLPEDNTMSDAFSITPSINTPKPNAVVSNNGNFSSISTSQGLPLLPRENGTEHGNPHSRQLSDDYSVRFDDTAIDLKQATMDSSMTFSKPPTIKDTLSKTISNSSKKEFNDYERNSYNNNNRNNSNTPSSRSTSHSEATTKEKKKSNRLSLKYIVSKLTKSKSDNNQKDETISPSNSSHISQSHDMFKTNGFNRSKTFTPQSNNLTSPNSTNSPRSTSNPTSTPLRASQRLKRSSATSLSTLGDTSYTSRILPPTQIFNGATNDGNNRELKLDGLQPISKVNSANTTNTKSNVSFVEPETPQMNGTDYLNSESHQHMGSNGSTPSQSHDLNYSSSMSRHNSRGKRATRPGSVISTYSIQTTISETSNGSGYVTGYSTDNNTSVLQNPYHQNISNSPSNNNLSNSSTVVSGSLTSSSTPNGNSLKRPAYNRAKTSELSLSIQNLSSHNLTDSPNSSFTTLSRNGSVDSSNRGRRKKKGASARSHGSTKNGTSNNHSLETSTKHDFLRRSRSPAPLSKLNTKWYKQSLASPLPLAGLKKQTKNKRSQPVIEEEESDGEESVSIPGSALINGNNVVLADQQQSGNPEFPSAPLLDIDGSGSGTGLGIKSAVDSDVYSEGEDDDERRQFEQLLLDDDEEEEGLLIDDDYDDERDIDDLDEGIEADADEDDEGFLEDDYPGLRDRVGL